MQINSTVSFTGKKPPKKPKTKNKGIITAGYVGTMAAVPTSVAGFGATKLMQTVSKLTPEETTILRRGVREGLKQSGLYDKGVRVYRMQEVSLPKLKDIVQNFGAYKDSYINGIKNVFSNPNNFTDKGAGEIMNTVFKAFIPMKYTRKDKKALNVIKTEIREAVNKKSGLKKIFGNMQQKSAANMPEEMQELINGIKDAANEISAKAAGLNYKLGNNAGYFPHANKIITPDKKLQTSTFHEMGHALNNNGSVILKALQKVRPVAMMLPGIILAAALLNKRKTTDEQLPTDSKLQRLKDTVKRNADKLTALAILPMIAEEGIASLRGGKIAKDLFKDGKLTKEILNKANKTNAAGFASYVLYAIGMVAAANTTIKIKDKMQAKYEAKQEAKYQAKLEKYNQKIAAKALKNTTQP